MSGRRMAGFWVLVPLLAGVGAANLAAQEQAPKPRRAVVTFDGKLDALPALSPTDFEIEAGQQKLAPGRVLQPGELPTVIAIVLQENQTASFGGQLPALRDFILSQPPNTYVGVFYLSLASINAAIGFDSNLQKVADALRAPKGVRDLAPPSPYSSMTNLINYMAKLPDARKEVLWFAEGSDALAGDATAPQNRPLGSAVAAAQETGIPVFVLFSDAFPPASRTTSDTDSASGTVPGRGSVGQQTPGPGTAGIGPGGGDPFAGGSPYSPQVQYNVSYLNYLTDRSGGKTFSAGKSPTDIRPFLEEFRRLLGQQVILEYTAPEAVKKVKLNRKVGDAKLLAPKR